MITFEDLESFLDDNYPESGDVKGLLLDVVNGVIDSQELKDDIADHKDHNG